MKDWFKKRAIPFDRRSTAPYLWLAICVWVAGAWLSRLASHWAYLSSFPPIYRELPTYLFLVIVTLIFSARLLGASWFLFGAFLIYVWTTNVAQNPPLRVIWALLLILMLLTYFILEGVELAVTELRDKDPDVFEQSDFKEKKISEALKEINQKRGLFYDAREWIIVLLVVFLSVQSDFEKLSLPGMGLISFGHAHTVFSLLFTTFIVVWLCQSPSKELATKNSVAFLKLTRFFHLWPYIRAIGTVVDQIKLQEPSRLIVDRFSRLGEFREPRDLRPSDAAYFIYGLKVFGFGLFKLHETLILEPSGIAIFTQRGLFYVINGKRKEFGRWYEFDSNFQESTTSVWAYFAPKPGETLTQDLQDKLEKAFLNQTPGEGFLPFPVNPRFVQKGPPLLANPKKPYAGMRRDYLIELPVRDSTSALAVGFEISFLIDPKGFKLPSGTTKVKDFLHKDVNFPWRKYEFDAELRVPGNTQFANLHGEATILRAENLRETKKMRTDSYQMKDFKRSISYPLIGAKYVWHWEIWP